MQNKRKLSEEHKRKIGEVNRIAVKKYYKNNPNVKNSGMFKKGNKCFFAGKENPKIQGKNHYRWKGGNRSTARKISIRYGKDLTTCKFCKEKSLTKRRVIHHIDGNFWNNEKWNQAVACDYCHNAIHDTPNRIKTRFQIGHTGYKGEVKT